MKKLLLAFLAAGTMAAAHAQEGSILLYGNAGILSNSNQESYPAGYPAPPKTNNFNWNVTPGIGYQLDKNWTVGLNLSYGQVTTKSDSTGNNRLSQNSYSVGVFGRYAHMFGDSKIFCWYGQLNVGYAGEYYTEGSLPTFGKAGGINVNLFPAVGANIGHQWALNFSVGGIGYQTLSGSGTNNATSSTFSFTLGQQANIGLSKNFGGHAHGHHHMGDDMRESNMNDDNDDNSGDTGKKHHHKHHKDDDNNSDE
jgi:hypothetical protein